MASPAAHKEVRDLPSSAAHRENQDLPSSGADKEVQDLPSPAAHEEVAEMASPAPPQRHVCLQAALSFSPLSLAGEQTVSSPATSAGIVSEVRVKARWQKIPVWNFHNSSIAFSFSTFIN